MEEEEGEKEVHSVVEEIEEEEEIKHKVKGNREAAGLLKDRKKDAGERTMYITRSTR